MSEIDILLERATEIFNCKPISEREEIIPNQIHAEIRVLQVMKGKIKKSAKLQCKEIDSWIHNMAKDLEKYVELKEEDM